VPLARIITPPLALTPGARLGPYEVVSALGAGGMGEVYRAHDPRLRREVAVKVLPASAASDPDRLRRFELEACAAGALNHPNVLVVFDVGAHDGTPYVVSELLEGQTLREAIRAGALTPARAVEYAAQAADGLAAAHEKGIVHRDLKPENLFLTHDGRIKILDFGLAKLNDERPAHGASDDTMLTAETSPGTVLGTIGYMSPEQVRGEAADHRTDVFALGAVLYETLTAKPAFRHASATETLVAVLKEDPVAMLETSRTFSPGLRRVLRRCLEKRAEDRYQSARDLAFELRGLAGPQPRPRSWLIAAAIATTVLVFVAAAAIVWQRRDAPGPSPAAGAHAKSIAVLPFQNLSPDPENAYFADGITEDILTQLAKVGELKVIARTSVMQYKDSRKPIREIARELGVGTLLEGSVRRAGTRVRIVGQLIDARTEQHLWAETYDRDLADIFAIQSEVAQQIAAALKTTLTPADKERIAQRPTANIEAYDFYVQGRERYYRYRKEDNDQAIELFRKALVIDPRFALAQAGLADALSQRRGRFGGSLADEEAAGAAGRRAVELDPQLPEAHKALALTAAQRGHIREAVAENRRAVELHQGTGFVGVANLGFTLFLRGRFDEALPWLRRSLERDPTNSANLGEGMGNLYDALGEPARAEAVFHRALEMNPKLGAAYIGLIRLRLRRERRTEALALARKSLGVASDQPLVVRNAAVVELVAGDEARGRTLLDRVLPVLQEERRAPDGAVETYLAWLETKAGRTAEAKKLLRAASAADHRHLDSGNDFWGVPFDLACVHAIEGDRDAAIQWLERAYEAGWRGWPQSNWSPLLDPLRGDPRFRRLMARIDADVAAMRKRAGL
jgi:TolB-like protein/Tfp pilus assembly protein PilF